MTVDMAVVVVHWNVAQLLEDCLRSIVADIAESGLSATILVVDNASPERRYRDVVSRFDGVRLHELGENRGYAAGCNAGIRLSDSQAVLLLNPDTELQRGAIRRMWETLHVSPHIGVVASMLLNPDGSPQSMGYRFPGVANVLFDLFALPQRLAESPLNGRERVSDGVLPVRIDYPLGAAMLLRRSALDEVGLLDESYGMYSEEIDLAQRLDRAGWKTLLVPSARIVHHGGQSTGQRADAMHAALWLSRATYFERYARRRQRIAIAALVELGLRWADRNATNERKQVNATIRNRFRQIVGRA